MTANVFLLLAGMVLLVKGADWFVSGASRIAKALKIPSLVIGLTLVSMGTSAPEASVSINSALNGLNGLSIGNVVGSNIFNTLFILGISSLIVPLSISKDVKRTDIPVMVGIYVLLIIFAFAITPLKLDIYESVILLILFIAYTVLLAVRAIKYKKNPLPSAELQRTAELKTPLNADDTPANKDLPLGSNTNSYTKNHTQRKRSRLYRAFKRICELCKKEKPLWLSVILAALGLAGIIYGGDIVVDSASAIAKSLGMSEILVGLTIVAVGTSLPELVTSVVASIKKENDIAVGNVIGSNIFNVIFILGLSSTISTLTLTQDALIDLLVMLGSGILIMFISLFSKKTNRLHGLIMLALYIGYLTYIILRN